MPNDEQRLLGQADGECAYETLELAAAEPDLVIGLFERFRYVIAAALIALALVSFLPLKGVFSDPGTYASTIGLSTRRRPT